MDSSVISTDPAASWQGRLLKECVACSLPLPLRLPVGSEEGDIWICTGCGASYHADFEESRHAYRHNVRRIETPDELEVLQQVARKTTVAAAAAEESAKQAAAQTVSKRVLPIPNRSSILCPLETRSSRRLDADIKQGRVLILHSRGEPFLRSVRRHPAGTPSRRSAKQLADRTDRAAEQLAELFDRLGHGNAMGVETAQMISRDALLHAAEDLDLFVAAGTRPPLGGYPSRHSLHVAMLAMATGIMMGWDRQTLMELGLGCLIHDVGMLCISPSLYQQGQTLSRNDFAEITKHSVLLFEMFERNQCQIPMAARMVAYQMHERWDGSGYPRGCSGRQIHELARIAGVADVFVALVTARPHRPGMLHYHAMEKIIHDTSNGLFDPNVVRAFLRAVCLFPIGSRVTLNDGRAARVVRSNVIRYDRPVVAIDDSNVNTEEIVDLARRRDLRVVSVLMPAPA